MSRIVLNFKPLFRIVYYIGPLHQHHQFCTWVGVNLNGGGSAAVGEPGAGVVLPQVAGGEIHLCGDDAADDNGDDHFI